MWVLFAILIQGNNYSVLPQGPFLSMDDCFAAREVFIESGPKPKINYEAVCIQIDGKGV